MVFGFLLCEMCQPRGLAFGFDGRQTRHLRFQPISMLPALNRAGLRARGERDQRSKPSGAQNRAGDEPSTVGSLGSSLGLPLGFCAVDHAVGVQATDNAVFTADDGWIDRRS